MPSADERDLRRHPDLPLTIGVFAAVFAALLPLLSVVRPWPWLGQSTFLCALVLVAGYVARRYRLPAVAVSLIELAVWALLLTFMFFRAGALLWIFPTPQTFRDVPEAVAVASNEIMVGAAPLSASTELAFLIVAAVALLAIVIDHVVLTARMPLLASVGLIAVSLIPAITVPGQTQPWYFVLLAGAILFLLRAESRARESVDERAESRAVGEPATALGIGAVAVVVAVALTPLLPQPVASGGAGTGIGTGIDVSLQLGDDLRRPRETEALRVRTDMASPPYLRAATLSTFTGVVWEPDRMRSVPLENETALGELSIAEGIRVNDYTTTVEVRDLVTPWLPVAFPAVAVTGLNGSWEAVPYNRTVISHSASTAGQRYQITTHVPRPTLEQVRAASASGPQMRQDTTQLPEALPPIITETAARVTAGASNDYDRLVALQRWFRGGEFRYSLEAPVEEGFDGNGADAVATFLEVKAGYCVHFASAFAIMARTLHMPSRIVVGFLPGSATDESVDGKPVFSVSTGQLHAWPEVYFEGIGWIPFEPTVGLGVPTSFSPSSDLLTGSAGAPTSTPNASPSADRPDTQLDDGVTDASKSQSAAGGNPLPMLTLVLGILLLLSIPALIQTGRTRRFLAAAERGDAVAAWTAVLDAAIDLGIAVPASESPRALGQRLVAFHGAPPDETLRLIQAVERASYGPSDARPTRDTPQTRDAAAAVRAALYASVPGRRRIVAVLIPRSLVVRPGSLTAADGARTKV